ncbi:MAG TPA: isoprenylcysteine carboxylmethyltransferase family protein [Pirellulales bacterium]|nr:isoprenylcysteine carboxylmethyltransferase family protein [Pirellulales bacterium]
MAASWAFRFRGLVGSLLLLVFGAAVAFSAPALPDAMGRRVTFEALGWAAFVAGAAIRFWATLYIGGRKRLTVVCEGPYSLCRNPLYVGTFLIAVSAALTLRSATFALGILLGAVFYAWATVPAEERYLSETLGEPYLRYCRRTPRFWPRFANFHTPATISVSVRALRNECRRAARWIWLPALVEVVSRLRLETWWPHWLNLP